MDVTRLQRLLWGGGRFLRSSRVTFMAVQHTGGGRKRSDSAANLVCFCCTMCDGFR